MVKTVVSETIPQETAPDAHVTVDLRKEFATGGQGTWYGTSARSLPWAIDDITLAFSDDLYDRMMSDAIVSSAIHIFKAGILADGVTLTSAIDKKDKEGYQQAADLVSWCEDMLGDLEGDLDSFLWDMLDALPYGNKVAELIYEPDATDTGTTQIVLRALHVKPRHALAFVTDPYKRLLGMLAMMPGQNVWPMTGIQIPDVDALPNFVPIAKFAVLTSRMEDNDPRGTSILRGAYDPWFRKEQTKAKHLQFLGVFAMASLLGFVPKNAQPTPRKSAGGVILVGPNGAPLYDYPADVMRDALVAFQNASVAVFPDSSPEGSRVQVVPAQGTGEPFLQAFSVEDREIVKAILTATLATGEGEHASRAQAGVHQDAQNTLTAQAKRSVCAMLRRQVLRRVIAYNYGDLVARRLTPQVSLGGIEQEDIAKIWTAVAALYTAGAIDESQKAELDKKVNLPERSVVAATVDEAGNPTSGSPAPAPSAPGQEPQPALVPAPAQQERKKAA